jgi:hypothetical protein
MIFVKRFFLNRVFVSYLTMAFSILSFASSAPAMFIPSPYEGNGTNHRDADLQRIQKLLESKLVQHKLLDDEQLHQIASQIHTLEPGGNGAVVVLILLLLGIGVFLVLELTGTIDVFK